MNLHGALDALTCTLDALKAQHDALNAQIRELKAENERLTEALREYATICTCGARDLLLRNPDDHYSFCQGETARRTLANKP